MTETKSKLPVFAKNECSEEFADTFCGASSDYEICSCGRVHYVDSPDVHEDKEYRKLKNGTARDPHKYLPAYDSIRWIELTGNHMVVGCPCNRLRLFEDFLWDNRQRVAEYYGTRASIKKAEADKAVSTADAARQAIQGD